MPVRARRSSSFRPGQVPRADSRSRFGIDVGDIVDGDDIYGDGVNVEACYGIGTTLLESS
jgi:hypothetical protein